MERSEFKARPFVKHKIGLLYLKKKKHFLLKLVNQFKTSIFIHLFVFAVDEAFFDKFSL